MKKIIRAIAFILILAVAMMGTYKVLSWKDTSGDYLSSTQQLYATQDNLMDVVFLGSSHVYCGVNPAVLWEEHGISAFDMAVSGQDRDSTFHTLKEVLKTQSPQVVCVDLYGLLYEEQDILGNVYRNMLSMKTSANSVELVHDYVEKEDRMDYILRWPIIHTRYQELTKYDFISNEPSVYGRGFVPTYEFGESYYPEEALACTDAAPLDENARVWLDEFIQLSDEEGFELVAFLAPMYLDGTDQRILNGAYEYLGGFGIEVIDFNKLSAQLKLDYQKDFCDNSHLNRFGADKLTAYFGNYLTETYELADHRGDSAYAMWDENSDWVAHQDFAYELKKVKEWDKYIEKVATYDEDMIVILSFDGIYKESTLNLQAAADAFGIPKEQYELGGKWIFEDGECVYYMDSTVTKPYTRELSEFNTLWMEHNASSLDQIQINGEAHGCAYNGLTVIVYDKITHRVVDKKGFF